VINLTKAALIEYGLTLPPLGLEFEFNPESLSRTRSISVITGNAPGTRGGYDFTLPSETPRVAQGVSVEPQKFSLEILLDATDRMNDSNHPGHVTAIAFGVEPELDTLNCMVEPKTQGPLGMQTLAALGQGGTRAFQRDEHPSVLLLIWGTRVLPVFLTSVEVNETAHLPTLHPYRAKVTLSFQVIEGNNPFYQVEKVRQLVGAGLNLVNGAASALASLF
jgi:contractile injection system tube protein